MEGAEEPTYEVLRYYCYTVIEDADSFRKAHHQFCLGLGLRGRVIIAEEGINGTISGSPEACKRYRRHLRGDNRFAGIRFNVWASHEHAFQKLHVRLKKEIVHAGLPELHPVGKAGAYVDPEAFLTFKDESDVVVLDVRSNYEHRLGTFRDAVTLDIDNFREFPHKLAELEHLKGKKVVTVCTNGIKCEKASAYLKVNGFSEVYQLHGGIVRYGLETDGRDFEGTCYVFDSRLAVPINRHNPTVRGSCCVCDVACSRMVNCANPHCNLHAPLCDSCATALEGCCSKACQANPDCRTYDGTGYYPKKMNGYNPHKCAVR